MKSLFVLGILGVLAAFILMVVLTSRAQQQPALPAAGVPAAEPGRPDLKIPPFALIDHTGKPQTEAVLDGHVTIVDFMFTNCPLACPTMTMQLQKLQKRLAGTGVRFLSMSIDPGNDTPAVLTSYINDRFKIDTSNWIFLTEPPGQPPRYLARAIFNSDLMQFMEEKPEDKIQTSTGGEMANINHSVNFFLIGPDRKALGWYNSQRSGEMDQLFDHAVNAGKMFLPANR